MLTFGPIGLFVYTVGVIGGSYVFEHREQYFDGYKKGAFKHAVKDFFRQDFFGKSDSSKEHR